MGLFDSITGKKVEDAVDNYSKVYGEVLVGMHKDISEQNEKIQETIEMVKEFNEVEHVFKNYEAIQQKLNIATEKISSANLELKPTLVVTEERIIKLSEISKSIQRDTQELNEISKSLSSKIESLKEAIGSMARTNEARFAEQKIQKAKSREATQVYFDEQKALGEKAVKTAQINLVLIVVSIVGFVSWLTIFR